METERLQQYLYALYFMLNNWFTEGGQIRKDLELKVCSQLEESFMSCLKWISVFTSGRFLNIRKIWGISLRVPQNDQTKNDKYKCFCWSYTKEYFCFRIQNLPKKRVWRNLTFGEKAVFLHLASSTRIIILLTFSARWKFSKFWLIEEENL